MLGIQGWSHEQRERSTGVKTCGGQVIQWLAVATVLTLPLVSVPLLPDSAATAIMPISVVFATLMLSTHGLLEMRTVRLPRWLLIGALLALAAVIASFLPVVVEFDEYGVSAQRLLTRSVRAIFPLLAACIYVAAFFVMLRSRHVGPERFVRLVLLAGVIHACVAVMALGTTLGVPVLSEGYRALREALTTSGTNPIGGLRRVAALSFEPSFAGFEYVGWWIPVSVALALDRRTRRIGTMLTVVFGVAAIATMSLTAALGLAVVAVSAAVGYVALLRGAVLRALVVCAAIVALALAPLVPPVAAVIDRVASQMPAVVSGELAERGPRDPSLAVRGALLHTALNVAVAYPVTGAGFGLAGYRFIEHRPAWTFVNPYMGEYLGYLEYPDGRVFPSAKNLYVRAWSEAGPVFLLVLVALIALGLRRAVACAYDGMPSSWRTLGFAAVMGISGSAAAYLSLDSFGMPYLWAWLGLVAGARLR